MKENLIKQGQSTQTILVPKGDDSKPCIEAFEKATGISIPEFEGRKLEATDGKYVFLKVKGSDIPGFIASGRGDIGITGSDSCQNFLADEDNIEYKTIGEKMCTLSLLAPAEQAKEMRKAVEQRDSTLVVATSFPRLLLECAQQKGLKLSPTPITVSGSVEIMPRLLGVPLVTDLVATGKTAEANGLVPITELLDVYPAIVTKTNPPQAHWKSVEDVIKIDDTFAHRALNIQNSQKESYTLSLLRDSNKAGKKAGEEFGEVMMAIFGQGSTSECESEIADVIYSQITAAYSQNKTVQLANILQILIDRNQQGSR